MYEHFSCQSLRRFFDLVFENQVIEIHMQCWGQDMDLWDPWRVKHCKKRRLYSMRDHQLRLLSLPKFAASDKVFLSTDLFWSSTTQLSKTWLLALTLTMALIWAIGYVKAHLDSFISSLCYSRGLEKAIRGWWRVLFQRESEVVLAKPSLLISYRLIKSLQHTVVVQWFTRD